MTPYDKYINQTWGDIQIVEVIEKLPIGINKWWFKYKNLKTNKVYAAPVQKVFKEIETKYTNWT